MVNSKRHGRHCATGRKITPLTGVGQTISRTARRNMALATSTGIALTLFAVPSAQASATTVTDPTANLEAQLSANPAVTVAQDVAWETEATSAVGVETKTESEDKAAETTVADANAQATATASASQSSYVPSAPAGSLFGEATRYIGTPYVWGGASPSGFDCSGFVQYVYAQNGVSLPRTSGAQAGVGVPVSLSEAKPGDIVSWGYHSGIYAGNGMVLHASQPGTPLGYSPMWGGYTIRRVG